MLMHPGDGSGFINQSAERVGKKSIETVLNWVVHLKVETILGMMMSEFCHCLICYF